jgi:thymidine phosphorylase
MVVIGGQASSEADAEAKVRAALASGAGRDKLRQMITWQGGDAAVVDDVKILPSARHSHQVTASTAGYVSRLDALLVGRAAVALGAGRDKKAIRSICPRASCCTRSREKRLPPASR